MVYQPLYLIIRSFLNIYIKYIISTHILKMTFLNKPELTQLNAHS